MKTFVIAEIGSNWQGSILIAKKIILECKKADADAVKFQIWRANDLYTKDHLSWNEIKNSELTFEKARKIKEFADEIKIEFLCSVFYPEGVKFLNKLKVKRFKVASRTCLFKDPFSKETLGEKAISKKPIIISMGMGGDKEKIRKIFKNNVKTFCYCISEYPLKFEKIKWKEALKFDGFSDHTMGITAPIVFSILKRKQNAKNIIIEKHVKLKNSKGPDTSTSITTEELKEMINHIRIIEKSKFE